MKIILLQDIKKVGCKFEVKEVPDGYARNFLIARKLAAIATPEMLAQKHQLEERDQEIIEKYQKLAKALPLKTFAFTVKAGKDNSIFSSVTKDDIKCALREKGVEPEDVLLSRPIKALGAHEIELVLGRGIKTKIKINVTAETQ